MLKNRLGRLAGMPYRATLHAANVLSHWADVRAFLDSFHATEGTLWDPPGSVRADEYVLLRDLCLEAADHAGPIVEIGTLFGFATTKMALWKRPDQVLITVDNYSWNPFGIPPDAHYQLTTRVLEFVRERANVEQLRLDKAAFFARPQLSPPAMVFLDAIHTYDETRKDIEWARAVGAPIICGHDYSDEFPGVMRAVDEAGGPRTRVGTLWRI